MNNVVARDAFFALAAKTFFLLVCVGYFSAPLLLQWGGEVDEKTIISLLSLVWFGVLAILACTSEKYYWLLAPLAVLFTPNAVNGMLPSSAMGPAAGNPSFSFVTHVDAYLLLGVLLYCNFARKVKPAHLWLVFTVAISFLVLLLSAIAREKFITFWFASFQLRYLFMLLLLFTYARPQDNMKQFASSLLVAAFLVFVEAAIFSFLRGGVRLTSGNYGVNLLGHFFAAMTVFTYFYCRVVESRVTLKIVILVTILTAFVISTGTRFSLLILLAGFGFLIFFRREGVVVKLSLVMVLIVILFLFFMYVPVGVSIRDGILSVWEGIHSGGALTITEDSSSMVTRLMLWLSTVHMISDNSLLGVSPGEWPFLKKEYGIPFDTVLDPHNELLNLLVNYGLVSGVIHFSIVYLFPLLKGVRIGGRLKDGFPWFALLVVFFFAGLSNSITWKHQLAFLVPYAALAVLYYKDEAVRGCVEK